MARGDRPALTVTTPSDREIEIRRDFDAPRAGVFDAITRPDLVRQWLLGPPGWTMPVCEIDLRPGGALHYLWRHPERGEMHLRGTFREIVRPSRIVHTELFEPDWTAGEATVTTVLAEKSGRTTLTLTIRYSSREARNDVLGSGMEAGIAAGYERLDEVLRAAA